MGMEFVPVTGTERVRLRKALLANAEDGTAIYMNPKNTSFVENPQDMYEEEVIAAIMSVPVHY